MRTCILCRFPVESDDVAVPGPGDRCVCVTCYARETESQKPMPKELRRWVMAVVNGVA